MHRQPPAIPGTPGHRPPAAPQTHPGPPHPPAGRPPARAQQAAEPEAYDEAPAPPAGPPAGRQQRQAAPPARGGYGQGNSGGGRAAAPARRGSLGAAIAGATMGVTRYPRPVTGRYRFRIELTKRPDRNEALIAEAIALTSDAPEIREGTRCCIFYQQIGGSADAMDAQHGSILRFIVTACGFTSVDELLEAWQWEEAQFGEFIDSCFDESANPLHGFELDCVATYNEAASEKYSKPIYDTSFSPVPQDRYMGAAEQ